MQIYFEAHVDYDCFIFSPVNTHSILLPENISFDNFIFLIQSSLDSIKPVFILNSIEDMNEIDLKECKSSHYKIIKNEFIFLNFSIRNSLSKMTHLTFEVKSIDEIQEIFEQNLKK